MKMLKRDMPPPIAPQQMKNAWHSFIKHLGRFVLLVLFLLSYIDSSITF